MKKYALALLAAAAIAAGAAACSSPQHSSSYPDRWVCADDWTGQVVADSYCDNDVSGYAWFHLNSGYRSSLGVGGFVPYSSGSWGTHNGIPAPTVTVTHTPTPSSSSPRSTTTSPRATTSPKVTVPSSQPTTAPKVKAPAEEQAKPKLNLTKPKVKTGGGTHIGHVE